MSVPISAPEQQTADTPAPTPSSFTSAVGKVKKGPYLDLGNVLVGHSAPFIRRTNDTPYKLHVYDIIELVAGQIGPAAHNTWAKIKKKFPKFQNHDTAIFEGELGTPACLSLKMAALLILKLPGEMADKYRELASDLVLNFVAQKDPGIAANLQAEREAEQQQGSSMIHGCVQPATMSLEQGNKLFEIELSERQIEVSERQIEVRKRQISCEDEELELYSKKARLTAQLRKEMIEDAVNNVQGMDLLVSLLSDGISKKTVDGFVQNHKANFVLRTTEHMATGGALVVPDSTRQAITNGPDVFQEGLPLQITTIMLEYKLVDDDNATIAKAIGRIAARMYREEFGEDPPKTIMVLRNNKPVEAFAYTNAHRKLLERACEEYIAERDKGAANPPKRKVHRALPR